MLAVRSWSVRIGFHLALFLVLLPVATQSGSLHLFELDGCQSIAGSIDWATCIPVGTVFGSSYFFDSNAEAARCIAD